MIGYVQCLSYPHGQENPAVELSAELPGELVSGLEDLRRLAQEVDKWVANVFIKMEKFMEDLAHSYQQTSDIMEQMDTVDQAWGEARIYQNKVVLHLEALMHTPLQTLVEGGVIQEGDRYDFTSW